MLHINDLSYRLGERLLFDAATLAIQEGDKIGFIGANGTGKTTFLRLLTGALAPDQGRITLHSGKRIAIVAQEAPDGPHSLLETVLAADTERSALLDEAEHATDPTRIADIHTRLADIDAHTAPARAAAILSGLGFDATAQEQPCTAFSGGWRMRVALAATLFAAPDLLLLDEPSNHLDLEATLWLEAYLVKYPGGILMVSHDRDLLNKVATRIVHLNGGKLTAYRGNYDSFERVRREQMELQAKSHAKQLAQRRHIQSFVDRFRAKASKARQAQSRLKALARMEPIAALAEQRTTAFTFPDPKPLPPPIITLDAVSAGYSPDKPVLDNLNLRIDSDDRIALLGANGNGKSTLARLLADRLKPLSGTLQKSGKLRVGYFAQHQAEELDLEATPFQLMAAIMDMAPESRIRGQLARFGFSGPLADVRAGKLSGGEKARLLFALISHNAPHILILDEPTNHLDIDAREALVQALNFYQGAVILVSHDVHLLELCAERLWRVADGGCQPWNGDIQEYRNDLLDSRRAAGRTGDRAAKGPKINRKDARRAAAEQRERNANLRHTVRAAEEEIARLTAEKRRIEHRLADPSLYDKPPTRVTEAQALLATVGRALSEAEATWLKANEQLEQSA